MIALGSLPAGQCVYILRDANGAALYVGCSGRLAIRLRAHMARSWWPDVASIDITRYHDRATALAAERTAIRSEAPAHNIIYRPLLPDDPRHGTVNGWKHQGCRCDRCRTAWRQREATKAARRLSRRVDPSDPRHGNRNLYRKYGCRCEACCAAQAEHQARRKLESAA